MTYLEVQPFVQVALLSSYSLLERWKNKKKKKQGLTSYRHAFFQHTKRTFEFFNRSASFAAISKYIYIWDCENHSQEQFHIEHIRKLDRQ
jgi:hypothetical protein